MSVWIHMRTLFQRTSSLSEKLLFAVASENPVSLKSQGVKSKRLKNGAYIAILLLLKAQGSLQKKGQKLYFSLENIFFCI